MWQDVRNAPAKLRAIADILTCYRRGSTPGGGKEGNGGKRGVNEGADDKTHDVVPNGSARAALDANIAYLHGGGLLHGGVRHEDGLGGLGRGGRLGESHGADSAGGESNGSSHYIWL